MGRQRQVFKAGDKLPGRLDEGTLACSNCWTVKRRERFLSRPHPVKGRWVSEVRNSCDNCQRQQRAQESERSERTLRPAPPLGGMGRLSRKKVSQPMVNTGKIPNERRTTGQVCPAKVVPQNARHPFAFFPDGAKISRYRHAWHVRWTDAKGWEHEQIAGW